MSGFRSAMAFLTIIPVGAGRTDEPTARAAARGWFPVVGLLIGVLLAGFDFLVLGMLSGSAPEGGDASATVAILAATVTVAAWALLTGALHLDGFTDTCDALWGGASADQRRRILKDPHVGAFAVVGVVCLLLVKVAALAALPGESRGWMLVFTACVGRAVMLGVMEGFPYVGGDGLGAQFLKRPGRWQTMVGLITAGVAGVTLVGPGSILMLALLSGVGWSIGRWATARLGGVTGDVFGAVTETVETGALLLAVVGAARWPGVLTSPLLALSSGSL